MVSAAHKIFSICSSVKGSVGLCFTIGKRTPFAGFRSIQPESTQKRKTPRSISSRFCVVIVLLQRSLVWLFNVRQSLTKFFLYTGRRIPTERYGRIFVGESQIFEFILLLRENSLKSRNLPAVLLLWKQYN